MGKSKRPKSQRGLDKPTGFEEYNADGPITPAEHEEMCKLYNPSRLFIDRFEDALMRFQHKRRILPDRLNVFHKYLQYGGVSAGQNYGTGVSAQEVKGMPEEEAMKARSQTAVHKSRENLEINFNEVLKGFLGSFYIAHFNPESKKDIELATVTIKNFYTYLLFHNVCPEYKDDIDQARKTCDLATNELWKNLQLVHNAPGAFNRSCSSLFGGYHFDSAWNSYASADDPEKAKEHAQQVARKVIKYAIAGAGSNDQASRFQQLANQNLVSAMKVEDIDGFEVLEVLQPDDSTREFYRETAPDLIPVGKIRAKSYRDAANPGIDMSPEERADWDKGNAPVYDFEFLLETEILSHCYPSLKIVTSVWELNCGVYFFDEIMSTQPSFYTVLANDLMLHWKWPKNLSKEEGKQQDLISESAEATVKQYLKFTDATSPEGATTETQISEVVTGFQELSLTDKPNIEETEKSKMGQSDPEKEAEKEDEY